MLDTRSQELEILDRGPHFYTQQEYEDCLAKLDQIGKWLGGDHATLSTLKKLSFDSFLDVGCGSGTLAIKVAQKYPEVIVVGTDLNPQAIAFANKQPNKPANVTFNQNLLSIIPDKKFDLVSSTLVLHHIPEQELTQFIQDSCRVAKKRVIINDLQRSAIALFLFQLISPMFRNRLIRHDGALSIRRAFKYHELDSLLQKAGLKPSQYTITWHWAFRWIVEINCEDGSWKSV